jgi:hypothetical protein
VSGSFAGRYITSEADPRRTHADWAIVVIGALLGFFTFDWFVHARYHFKGPTEEKIVVRLSMEKQEDSEF